MKAEESWTIEVNCPSCSGRVARWGRGLRPANLQCRCGVSFEPAYFTREELHEKVWTVPMIKLAQQYVISDVGLRKLCRRVAIPVPKIGYWQQKRQGRTPPRFELPKQIDQLPGVIALSKRLAASEKPARPLDVEEALTREGDARYRCDVPSQLRSPHPLVRETSQVLAVVKSDATGIVRRPASQRCLNITVSKAILGRALRVMDALAKAVEGRGWSLSLGEDQETATRIGLFGEKVSVVLAERMNRAAHALTPKEAEDRQKYGRVWGVPRWDYTPSGELELRLQDSAGHGLRRAWSDGKGRRLEECLNDFLTGVVLIADAKRAERVESERRHREWLEAERRRAESEARRRVREKRLQALERHAEQWARAERLRTYLDALERRLGVEEVGQSERFSRWLGWARKQADRFDPIPAIVTELNKRR
jgi:hypothetical protein